jgi:hypothetical protein
MKTLLILHKLSHFCYALLAHVFLLIQNINSLINTDIIISIKNNKNLIIILVLLFIFRRFLLGLLKDLNNK